LPFLGAKIVGIVLGDGKMSESRIIAIGTDVVNCLRFNGKGLAEFQAFVKVNQPIGLPFIFVTQRIQK